MSDDPQDVWRERYVKARSRLADAEHERDHCRRQYERLEAELAACEQVREAIAAESRDRYAELADLRASSVVVRRKCETCFGHGFWTSEVEGAEDITCLDCDNGWQLAEGVAKQLSTDGYDYVFPARLIEGDG